MERDVKESYGLMRSCDATSTLNEIVVDKVQTWKHIYIQIFRFVIMLFGGVCQVQVTKLFDK